MDNLRPDHPYKPKKIQKKKYKKVQRRKWGKKSPLIQLWQKKNVEKCGAWVEFLNLHIMVHESPWIFIVIIIFFIFFYIFKEWFMTHAGCSSWRRRPCCMNDYSRTPVEIKITSCFPCILWTLILLVFFMFLFLILFYTGTDTVYCKIY